MGFSTIGSPIWLFDWTRLKSFGFTRPANWWLSKYWLCYIYLLEKANIISASSFIAHPDGRTPFLPTVSAPPPTPPKIPFVSSTPSCTLFVPRPLALGHSSPKCFATQKLFVLWNDDLVSHKIMEDHTVRVCFRSSIHKQWQTHDLEREGAQTTCIPTLLTKLLS